MKKNEFVKGQKAWVHSKSERYSDYETTVISVGKKYITCQQQESYPKQKFDVGTLTDVDWSNYVLYENSVVCEKDLELANKRLIVCRYADKLIWQMSESGINKLYDEIKDKGWLT